MGVVMTDGLSWCQQAPHWWRTALFNSHITQVAPFRRSRKSHPRCKEAISIAISISTKPLTLQTLPSHKHRTMIIVQTTSQRRTPFTDQWCGCRLHYHLGIICLLGKHGLIQRFEPGAKSADFQLLHADLLHHVINTFPPITVDNFPTLR